MIKREREGASFKERVIQKKVSYTTYMKALGLIWLIFTPVMLNIHEGLAVKTDGTRNGARSSMQDPTFTTSGECVPYYAPMEKTQGAAAPGGYTKAKMKSRAATCRTPQSPPRVSVLLTLENCKKPRELQLPGGMQRRQ